MKTHFSIAVLCSIFFVTSSQAADWPGFRGLDGRGISTAKNLPVEWSQKKNVKWKFELPGPGNSSPVFWGERIFVNCATEKGQQRHLYCIDRNSGELRWRRTVVYREKEIMHKTNPYCGSTPVTDGNRIVVWHGSAGLYCYDMEGQELWSQSQGKFTHIWGYGSSPVIHKGVIFLNCGPGKRSFMLAVRLSDGEELWRKEEPGGIDGLKPRMVGSWSTPIIVNVNGQDQLIASMPKRVLAYNPKNGRIIWECSGIAGKNGDLVYTSPVVSGNTIVVMGGYHGPSMAIRLGGKGDITHSHVLWRQADRQPQRIGSGVIVDGYMYMANADDGTVFCIDMEDGKVVWRKRLNGGAHWGSLILTDRKFYVTGQNGTTHVFRPNPKKYDGIASNELGETSNSTPAFADGEIFIRTWKALYCIAK